MKAMNKKTAYLDWGMVEYKKAWENQEELFKHILNQKKERETTDNYLVFCEHPHVYTLGKSGVEQNLLVDYIQLQNKKATFFHTNRGGDITYHGPGQIVGYPIIDLENFGLSLKAYIQLMETAIIELLSDYGIVADHFEEGTGVWLNIGKPDCRKICAIGVKASRYVTMHGFALNVNTDLDYFSYINPCGFVDKGVTSMEKELGKPLNFEKVKNDLAHKFTSLFGFEMMELKVE